MNSEWQEMSFSEAVLINPLVRLDRGVVYPFVDMAAVSADSRSVYPAEQREFKGGGARFQNGDTLMARITPCLENGKIARYHSQGFQSEAYGSTEFIVIRGCPKVTDNDFAYYLTRWEEVRNYAIGQMTGTSGRQRVPTQSLDHLTVSIPSLSEQRAIAHILGTLDDKIELNRRMNETLEEIARVLFKSWFIDFDPVRAKMEGRDPGLPKHLADLFPDRLVDSELGSIPEGWVADNLGSYVNFQNGYAFRSGDWQNNGVPVVKIGSIKPGLVDLTATSYVSPDTVVDLERFKLNPGDILVGMTGYPGETGLVPIHDPHPYLNQRVGRIEVPQDHSENYAWIYAQVRNQSFKRHAETRAHGSAQANISGRALLEYPVVFPGKALLKHYSDFAIPLISRYLSNDAESRTLAAQRDALLPKLMSGDLRVDVEDT